MNKKYVKRWKDRKQLFTLSVQWHFFAERKFKFIILFEICNFQFTDIEVYEVGNSLTFI